MATININKFKKKSLNNWKYKIRKKNNCSHSSHPNNKLQPGNNNLNLFNKKFSICKQYKKISKMNFKIKANLMSSIWGFAFFKLLLFVRETNSKDLEYPHRPTLNLKFSLEINF